jgi:hypothetical protein
MNARRRGAIILEGGFFQRAGALCTDEKDVISKPGNEQHLFTRIVNIYSTPVKKGQAVRQTYGNRGGLAIYLGCSGKAPVQA